LLRKSTHMAKTYEAGQDTSWLERFESDLKSGAFGQL